jgi:ribosomal protein S6--L-glutamate ligase
MRIGIVTVRDSRYHPNRRLREAAEKRGHRAVLLNPYAMWPALVGGRPGLAAESKPPVPDAVLPRQGAEIGESSLALIDHLEGQGIPVVNGGASIRAARNQFKTLQRLAAARLSIPDSVLINSVDGFPAARERLGDGPVVLKRPSGRQGAGVFLARTETEARRILAENLDPRFGMLVQQFIDPAGGMNIRSLTIGNTAVAAMLLHPVDGDFRANYHLSGQSRPFTLPPDLESISLTASHALGLDIAGVDILIDRDGCARVIEVNYAPGFKGLEAATGIDIADRMVAFVERAVHRSDIDATRSPFEGDRR